MYNFHAKHETHQYGCVCMLGVCSSRCCWCHRHGVRRWQQLLLLVSLSWSLWPALAAAAAAGVVVVVLVDGVGSSRCCWCCRGGPCRWRWQQQLLLVSSW